MLDWIRWMLVDSSGSRNPLASPIATHVAVPELAALAGDEAQHAAARPALAVEIGHQRRGGLVLADEAGC